MSVASLGAEKRHVTGRVCSQCGLDQAKSGIAPLDEQEQVMREQLKLGKELRRPVSVILLINLPHWSMVHQEMAKNLSMPVQRRR